MLKNHFLIAWRNIKKHKTFSLLNISGLAIGLACCFLLVIYINSELRFDTYHEKKDRIFRICEDVQFANFQAKSSATNGVIADALKKDYPEIEETARFYLLPASVKYDNKQFSDRFFYTDASVFDIFTWPLLNGDPQTALSAPYSMVLTEKTARKYFGSENPVGKTITLNENEDYKVTGILRDIPEYSTFQFAGLTSFSTLYGKSEQLTRLLTAWSDHNFSTYVLLKEGVDFKRLASAVKDIYFRYIPAELKAKGANYKVFLQPLRDVYLRPLQQNFGPMMYVYIFIVIALFVLLIACANFINLSTARSLNRAAEVGIRKLLGANRSKLIIQFLGETVLLSTLAMIGALGIVFLALPKISRFADRDLGQGLFIIPWLVPGVLGVTILVGLVAGSYPAFFFSNLQPTQALKSGSHSAKGNINFRRSLVFLQFTISVSLIIGTWLVVQQLDFLKDRDPGFDKEHVMYVMVRDPLVRQKLTLLKEQIKHLPAVVNAGAASSLPGWGAASCDKIPEGYTRENTQLMLELNVDEDYLPALGIKIIAGRNFSKKFTNDPRNSVIINEAAVKRFAWDQPIGKTIKTADIDKLDVKAWEDRTVVGVVKDFNIDGVANPIDPAFIGNVQNFPFTYGQISVLAVRIMPHQDQAAVASIEKIWKNNFPGKSFKYYFLEEDYNEQFLKMERSRDIFSYFAFFAIFIACLGLFGMATYAAEKRVKEIGIRKTLGSSVAQIVALLSKELIYIVLAANLIAYPIAYYLIKKWLEDYPIKINISVYTFLLSTLLVVMISFFTTAFQSIKAARANPAKSLRNQ